MPAALMQHDVDPAEEIWNKIGNLNDIDIFNRSVLLAVYLRPTKTKSGLYLSDQTRQEDEYQGKVGMIVKMGKAAFRDPNGVWFKGDMFTPGDWIAFRPSDGWPLKVNGVLCRVLDDTYVKIRAKRPDLVF